MNIQKELEVHNIQRSQVQNPYFHFDSNLKYGFNLQTKSHSNSFLPSPEDTKAYQGMYPGFIEKMMHSFDAESEHRRSLEKDASQHKKRMSEKLVEAQIQAQVQKNEIEAKEQKHQHAKFYIALVIGLSVFFSAHWFNIENKSAFIGLYILLAVLGLSPKSLFFKRDKTEIQKNIN